MLGELNPEMVEEMLKTQLLGRIGCHADGVTYIVPVHYAYEAPYLYANSAKGMKIDIMRKNPQVCFEIDKIENFFNWQSVICWGTFEEITEVYEMEQALQKIVNRIEPYLQKAEDAHPAHGIADSAYDIGITKELVVYKIKLTSKTGRFEHRELVAVHSQEG